MDQLHIEELTALTTIGIHDWEKATLQKVSLDITLACDCSTISKHDDIKDAYDYDAISQKLLEYLKDEKTDLIETLAEKLTHYLHEITGSAEIKLKLTKPGAIKAAKRVAVSLEGQF